MCGNNGAGVFRQRPVPVLSACAYPKALSLVEAGKGADALDRRPVLAAALAEARRLKCPVAFSEPLPRGRKL